MKDERPVNLDLATFSYPLAAVASILHRISGAALFLGAALPLYLLQRSLESEAGFREAVRMLERWPVRLALWAVLAALSYHLIAGIRHLLLDFGVGESLRGGRAGAAAALALSAAAAAAAGVWLW